MKLYGEYGKRVGCERGVRERERGERIRVGWSERRKVV